MIRMLAGILATSSALLIFVPADAQTQAKRDVSEQHQSDLIRLETAPIKTREDLVRYLSNQDPTNPLNKLSEQAKNRLIDTLTVNNKGEISSFYIADIKSELTPTEAYKVFSLFGTPELAGKVNNGKVESDLDEKIKSEGMRNNKAHPAVQAYYCNGGYCQENRQMTCVENRCQPPR